MKIILVDNFDRETQSDVLIADCVSAEWARRIADTMNARYSGENSSVFFRVVSDDYKLFVFEP